MTIHKTRFPIFLTALGLLAGCAGSNSGEQQAVYTVPTTPPPAYSPPVSKSYVIEPATPVSQLPPQLPMATFVTEPAAYVQPAPFETARLETAPFETTPAETARLETAPAEQTRNFETTELFEIVEAENARREAEARASALAELIARIDTVREENMKRGGNAQRAAYESGFAPFEVPQAASVVQVAPDTSREAERTAALLVAAEAEIAAARQAAAQAEAAAIAAEAVAAEALASEASTRRAMDAAARREASRVARANPPQQRRSFFSRFATRNQTPAAPAASQPEPRRAPAPVRSTAPAPVRSTAPAPARVAAPAPVRPAPQSVVRSAAPAPVRPAPRFVVRSTTPPPVAPPTAPARQAPPPRQMAALVAPPPSPPARPIPVQPRPAQPRPNVERSPIPGLKPYILARTPSPTSKPRRAKPQRSFDVRNAAVLPGSTAASVVPPGVTIPREPGGDLSARFFPTPGKPSTLGTERDTQIDLASIDANPYGIGSALGDAVDPDAATAEWTDAVRLIENGEVEALAILEDSDLELTLCSGRSILTTPPDLSAAATLTAPQIICGQNKPLALR